MYIFPPSRLEKLEIIRVPFILEMDLTIVDIFSRLPSSELEDKHFVNSSIAIQWLSLATICDKGHLLNQLKDIGKMIFSENRSKKLSC